LALSNFSSVSSSKIVVVTGFAIAKSHPVGGTQ
jgi:hypothetical protein